MPNFKVMGQVLLFVSILTAGNVLWKYGLIRIEGFMTGSKTLMDSVKDLLFCPQMWIGSIFYVGGTLFWFYILSREDLSYVYPMVSIGYVLTSLMGMVLFNETIPPIRFVGMGVVFVGFILLSLG